MLILKLKVKQINVNFFPIMWNIYVSVIASCQKTPPTGMKVELNSKLKMRGEMSTQEKGK